MDMETPFDKLMHELAYHYYDRDSWVHDDQRRGFIRDFENTIRAEYAGTPEQIDAMIRAVEDYLTKLFAFRGTNKHEDYILVDKAESDLTDTLAALGK